MNIKRWNGTALIAVTEAELPTYAKAGLYIECGQGSCRHLWILAPTAIVPTPRTIKKRIKKEVPHM